VLSLVRSDPRRAERALEDLAELFRALMSDARQLVPLADEVQLTRAYLELEQLRLGDRLDVVWHVEKMPADSLIPPLLIQPLVENAVYHGIEPQREGGEISLNIFRSAAFCLIER
jgi:two-component system sensor histidine kinase AlgZ